MKLAVLLADWTGSSEHRGAFGVVYTTRIGALDHWEEVVFRGGPVGMLVGRGTGVGMRTGAVQVGKVVGRCDCVTTGIFY